MMLETMIRCKMKIANTYFRHSDKNTGTWTNPATKRKRVIDHAVVRAWQLRHVLDVRARPTWNVDSDHEICTITLRGNPRGKRTERTRWRVPGLTSRKGRLEVDILADERFETAHPDSYTSQIATAMEQKLDSITTMKDFDEALREVAEKILPKRDEQGTWDTENREEIEAAIEERRRAQALAVSHPSEKTASELKNAEKALRRTTRTALYLHLKKKCDKMQDLADAGKGLPRDFFKELANVKRFLGCYG